MKYKKIVFLLSFFVVSIGVFPMLSGCSDDSSYPFTYSEESTIYSDDQTAVFRELLLTLKPYIEDNNERKYILTDSIFNIVINVNDDDWGTFNSSKVDTTIFNSEQIGGFRVVLGGDIKYAIIAPLQAKSDTLTTAGEYSDLLNNFFTLQPGYYFISIPSFDIRDASGTVRTIKTSIVEPLEIKAGSRSAFLGGFDVLVNQ